MAQVQASLRITAESVICTRYSRVNGLAGPPVSESSAVRHSVSRVSRMPSACRSLKAPVKRASSGLPMAATATGRISHGIGSSTPKT